MLSLSRSGSLAAWALLVSAGCGPVPGGSLSGALRRLVERARGRSRVLRDRIAAGRAPLDEVRVRFGDQLFELRAVHATDPAEREPVLRFRGYDPVPAGIALFRFEPQE